MLRVLRIVVYVVVSITVLAGAGIAYLVHTSKVVDSDAQAYVDVAVPKIIANWSVDAMRQEASPDLLKSVKPDDLQNLFALYAKLGPLVTYQNAKASDWNVSTSLNGGKVTTVHCIAHASFAHGEATIDVVARKQDDAWKIQRFNVNSADMIANAVGRAI
jgi:hypothetical protein